MHIRTVLLICVSLNASSHISRAQKFPQTFGPAPVSPEVDARANEKTFVGTWDCKSSTPSVHLKLEVVLNDDGSKELRFGGFQESTWQLEAITVHAGDPPKRTLTWSEAAPLIRVWDPWLLPNREAIVYVAGLSSNEENTQWSNRYILLNAVSVIGGQKVTDTGDPEFVCYPSIP
jgi:hypothetical protein